MLRTAPVGPPYGSSRSEVMMAVGFNPRFAAPVT